MPQRRCSSLGLTLHPLAVVLITTVVACEPEKTLTSPPRPAGPLHADVGEVAPIGAPLPFLTAAQRAVFARGSAVFLRAFTPSTGLGPLFNGSSCGECHEDPVIGGVGDEVETHATAFRADGTCDDLAAGGGPVIEDSVTPALLAVSGLSKAPVPPGATAIGRRTTSSILGFGLLDAVPDWEILALADPSDRNHDGISGRPNRTVDGQLGRFGRKAQVARLRDFVAGAFLNEMGVTNPTLALERGVAGGPVPPGVDPAVDPELSQGDLDATTTFVQLLAPPRPLPLGPAGLTGALVFAKIGCPACHVPALVTGYNRVSALSLKAVYAYTDLLLHDMGPDLADICLGQATPAEFRTAPLMGLRFAHAYLHDGRATTIEQSILLHGGEGARSRDRFARLSPFERFTLLKFLGSL